MASTGYCRDGLKKLVEAKGETVIDKDLYEMNRREKEADDCLRGIMCRLRKSLAKVPVVLDRDKGIGYRLVPKG